MHNTNINLIALEDSTLDFLAVIFITKKILDKYGLTFIAFIEEWKKGKIQQYI